MKINQNIQEVTTRGGGESNQFSIAMNAKMFNILSSQVYKNKHLAIIRELSANALDAHKEAGNSKPFKVYVPSQLKPELVIEDFGVGMDEETLTTLYTTYGHSSKNDSNSLIGGLGIGSKSPFAYTKMFNVTSRFNGFKTTFNCHIGTDGVPTIKLMHKEATKEPNGLTVSVPVEMGDVQSFRRNVHKALYWFDKGSVEVVGLGDTPLETVEYSQRKPLYGIRERNDEVRSGFHAVMGNLGYEISVSDMNIDDNDLRASFSTFQNSNIDLFFDIGDLEISASRETLDFNKETIRKLSERLQEVMKTIVKDFKDSVKTCKNLKEACAFIETSCSNQALRYSLLNSNTDVFYKGVQISYNGYYEITRGVKETKNTSTGTVSTAKFNFLEGDVRNSYYQGFKFTYPKEELENLNATINPCGITHVLVDDITHMRNKRLKHYLETDDKYKVGSYHDVLLLKLVNPNYTVKEALKDLKLCKGTYTLTYLSEVELPKSVLKAQRSVIASVHESGVCLSGYWRPKGTQVDLADTSQGTRYYVEFRNQVPKDSRFDSDKDSTQRALQAVEEVYRRDFKKAIPTVYGIPASRLKDVEKNPTWVNLFDFIKEEAIKEFEKRPRSFEKVYHMLRVKRTKEFESFIGFFEKISMTDVKKGRLFQQCKEFERCRYLVGGSASRGTPFKKVRRFLTTIEALSPDTFEEIGKSNFKDYSHLNKKVLDKYGMLMYVPTYVYSDDKRAKRIEEYIELVEKKG
jgi:hypothetical protein